ncbi:MAG: RHS repeat domain-containing protein [Desulfovibrio sp.]
MERKYSLQLERGGQGRITAKNENVNGWPVSWEYRYDGAGRLAGVNRDGAGVELYLYDAQDRRAEDYVPLRGQMDRVFRYGPDNRLLQAGDARYEHDSKGFRSRKVTPQGETRYHYAPDYRLLAVELPDGRVVEYAHDEQGLRNAKYVDGRLTERFHWHDRAHLAAWSHADLAGGQWWEVVYGRDGRPMGLVTQDHGQGQGQGAEILLHTDQIGSVRMVEFPTEGMVKEILYDAFGNVVRDGNPYLRSPLGFAGGLHDWDTGLVRFGWRDYDPDTGRFTAQDPIGAAGGDPDWYGYCLDDPVNGRDPEGLSSVEYNDEEKEIVLRAANGTSWDFPADNRTVRGHAHYPSGNFPFAWHSEHDGADENSSYGSNGNFIFDVKGRTGMGVHAGRANKGGIHHPTYGCIRTTDTATNKMSEVHKVDPLSKLYVRHAEDDLDPESWGR